MKRLMVAVSGVAVTLAAVMPASAWFIYRRPAVVWGPHYYAYPPTAAYPPVAYPPSAAANPPVATAPSSSVVVVPPVGSYVRTLPAGCTSLTVNSASYFRCGSVYYKPTFLGTTLMYEVVNNPG